MIKMIHFKETSHLSNEQKMLVVFLQPTKKKMLAFGSVQEWKDGGSFLQIWTKFLGVICQDYINKIFKLKVTKKICYFFGLIGNAWRCPVSSIKHNKQNFLY